ncbi:DUF255 domain-containing protein [Chitinophagales bacterium]|nr:DUF255 domain-containing protein [Chitinophagales bacterium]
MRILPLILVAVFSIAAVVSCTSTKKAVSNTGSTVETVSTGINWVSLEEAQELAKKNPKKIFIDVYTDWCGWCKKMDRTTFQDPEVAVEMNKHFYAVKFDAEDKRTIEFDGRTYRYSAAEKTNELALKLLYRQMSFPSYAILNAKLESISVVPGYIEDAEMEVLLGYFGDDHYKDTSWERYSENLLK